MSHQMKKTEEAKEVQVILAQYSGILVNDILLAENGGAMKDAVFRLQQLDLYLKRTGYRAVIKVDAKKIE